MPKWLRIQAHTRVILDQANLIASADTHVTQELCMDSLPYRYSLFISALHKHLF